MTGKSQSEDRKAQLTEFVEKILKDVSHPVAGKMGISSDVIQNAVVEDPELAAEFVYTISRQSDVPSTMAQLAITIAVVYRVEFNDDSLEQEVQHAPWAKTVAGPSVLQLDEPESDEPQPDPRDELFDGDPDASRILEVALADLQQGSVEYVVNLLSIDGVSPALAQRLGSLWGKCVLTFPLNEDPRPITQIPEVRTYMARLHQAMPYFPCYLDYRSGFGMFFAYFGCLAAPESLTSDGLRMNLMDDSVLSRLEETLTAIPFAAQASNKDPRPVWRAILSHYPKEVADEYFNQLTQ